MVAYVEHADVFPDVWSGSKNIPHEAWHAWEEPYRVSYRDYVAVQREKEAGVAGVRDTLKRARIYQKLHPSVAAVSHLHMGATCMVEQMAVMMLGRSARFAPSPRWRNISVFGMLDEIRHAQLDLLFSHDLLKYESRFDWCQKAFHIRCKRDAPNEGVLITVEDSGTGFDPSSGERIFDSMFTTKEGGMGMGLSISRSIIAAHGGRIWASPGESVGAIFHIVLPSKRGVVVDQIRA